MEDDQLRLIFTCCHPALGEDAQVALTLREVCGLTTEEIASAFLTARPTMAQRIVRAKAKIRDAGIPYRVPEPDELPERLDAVLRVVYLVFNEGYFASDGRRPDARRSVRRGRCAWVGCWWTCCRRPRRIGLLALMLLTESRRPARTDGNGELVLLEDQDRGLWDRRLIDEGLVLLGRAMASRHIGPYTVQAAIGAEHARAVRAADTDWAASSVSTTF